MSLPKPTRLPCLTQLAIQAKSILVLGIGGGGDVIQTLPVVNFLRLLGKTDVVVGGVACSWWTKEGDPISDQEGLCVYGPTLYNPEELTPCDVWAPGVVGITAKSHWKGRRPAEAVLAHLLPPHPFVISLLGGAQGVRISLENVIAQRQIDFVIAVDIGSDCFHDGKEACKAFTSLVDFISMAALTQLSVPVIYSLAGYGADGEMQLEELDERVARVMAAGGYLGALGMTREDVLQVEEACALYPDPVEPFSASAARGKFGYHNVMTKGPWGVAVKITPLAAVSLHFDPNIMVQEVCRGVTALKATTSLHEAEAIYREQLGQIPESKLEKMIRFYHP